MTYRILNSPFSGNLRNLKRREVKAFYEWLMDQLPDRIAGLENVVRETEPLLAWKADYTPDSLRGLSQWFAGHVEMRPRAKEEIDKLEAETRFKGMGIFDGPELALVTQSFVVDIALYLGEVMRRQFPHTHWEQFLKDKRFDSYGKPVLSGFGVVSFDPIRLMSTVAYRFGKGEARGEDIFRVFAIWARHAMANDPGAPLTRV